MTLKPFVPSSFINQLTFSCLNIWHDLKKDSLSLFRPSQPTEATVRMIPNRGWRKPRYSPSLLTIAYIRFTTIEIKSRIETLTCVHLVCANDNGNLIFGEIIIPIAISLLFSWDHKSSHGVSLLQMAHSALNQGSGIPEQSDSKCLHIIWLHNLLLFTRQPCYET